jgi:hypothetical protein
MKCIASRYTITRGSRAQPVANLTKHLKSANRLKSIEVLHLIIAIQNLLTGNMDTKMLDAVSHYGVLPYMPKDFTLK